ncbi:hypothetical protein [Siminovitchia sp. FSL W7-1587]|uniref:hypothetical protein n=1 Tax=Siminovitchia sp. FSL W7-1587 TaxID=2954699 RepID=UPI0030D57627
MNDKEYEKLVQKLDEYQVDVPDFPMKKSRLDRAANWLFDPVSLPVWEVHFTKKGMAVAMFFPVLLTIISAIPFIFL